MARPFSDLILEKVDHLFALIDLLLEQLQKIFFGSFR